MSVCLNLIINFVLKIGNDLIFGLLTKNLFDFVEFYLKSLQLAD